MFGDDEEAAVAVTRDSLLDGRVHFSQPRQGYRVAIDTVLLAAAVPATAGERVLELGTGVAAAALCLAWRVAGVAVVGLERQAELARLATENIAANRVADRVRIVEGDVRDPTAVLAPASFDRVMANPPYLRSGAYTVTAGASRRAANHEGETGLCDWIAAAAALLRPRGSLTLIHRADRLTDVIVLLQDRFGGLILYPLWPRAGAAARRIVVQARLGSRAPTRLAAGLVLHGAGSGYSAAAEAILRDGKALEL